MPSGSDVSSFWLDHYGIANYSEFHGIVNDVLRSGLPFGNFGLNDLYATSAWNTPNGPSGLAVQLYLSRAGYTGDAAAAAKSQNDLVTQSSANGIEEQNMATLIIPNAFQVTIGALVGERVVDNVIGVVNASGSSAGAAAAVKAAWEDAGGPLQYMTNAYEMVAYTAVDLSSGSGDIVVLPSTATGDDSSAGIATRGACALLKWNGSSRSRSTRGRMYWGPLMNNQVQSDGATLATTFHTELTNNFTQFLGELSAAGYPLAVLSRKLSQATLVSSWGVETTLATQRRRIRD